ncbi:sugar transferase [Candidatus Villigracilis saccharophilus]|uniref:sugar transferase n=1 Tax=Candidatus Villigracilis saccharophilus TaxID=3140684 RepID=UPI0031373CE4|nr:sugar transferase [Anaerolineales bacterium]
MIRRFSVNFAIFALFMDLFVITAVLWVSQSLRPFLDAYLPVQHLTPDLLDLPLVLYIFFPLVWVVLMIFFSVYDGRKNLRVVDEFTSLTFSSALAGITLAGVMYLSYRDVSRALFTTFVLAAYLMLLIWRLIARPLYWRWHRDVERVRHVLIAGAGPVGRIVEKRLSSYFENGMQLIGFLDDDPQKLNSQDDVLGQILAARLIVEEKHIDDLVIALPRRAYNHVNALVESLQDLPVRVWIVPDYFELALHQARLAEFAGLPMLDLNAAALSEYQRMIKRVFDLLVIGVFVIPAFLVMAVVALAIFIFDGRPILFKQSRAGENGRLFTLYKFRTMVVGAEFIQVAKTDVHGNILHKQQGDPRVTPLGRFLRRFSLDELPQLINVLNGDMSLVGPRPELPELVKNYQPWQRERFAIPQGLTGWWQIHGRSDKPMHLHTEEDLYYVKNYSFWLDLYILMRTFWIVLRGKGAY